MIPADCFAIDAHAHLGRTREFPLPWGEPDRVIRRMDATHIRLMVFSHMAWLGAQFETGFAQTIEAVEAHPERLLAYAVFDPHWPDESLRWIEELESHPSFAGIKIHPARHGVAPTDSRYRDLWSLADERAWVVLTHSWAPDPANPRQDFSTPDLFAPVLEHCRNLKLILGHSGGRPVGHQRAVELAQRFPNCFMDISGDTTTLGILEWLVERAGADRILFGTDQTWIESRIHLGRVLTADLTPGQKMAILEGNALRLFNLEPRPTEAGTRQEVPS